MTAYSCRNDYLKDLEDRAALPAGFAVSTAALEFSPREIEGSARMNLTLIALDEPTPLFAAGFTTNRVAGAPVLIGRKRLAEPRLRGVLINNKVANVCAPGGREDAESLLAALAGLAGGRPEEYWAASTGVIGWRLPAEAMRAALPGLAAGLRKESALPAARAIMTTDSYPKLRGAELGGGRITGIVKGAGMIEPNMGTMLAFLLTDIAVDREALRRIWRECLEASFNSISVDGDQSTSDLALIMSSGRIPGVDAADFRAALLAVCRELAADIVRNGEGVGHVIRVVARGADAVLARGAAKAIVNSPLVKTAVWGNDPNVGRIVSAVGDFLSGAAAAAGTGAADLAVSLGGVEVFRSGSFRLDRDKEASLSRYLRDCAQDPAVKGYPQHDREVLIELDLGGKGGAVEVLGSDLSEQYVRENADYRS
jgi:glutamate N-acetyltransferase/amino-acid N-acetyltransferase